MKRFFLFLLFLFASQGFSAYIGNPASPALMQTGLFNVKNHFINVATGYLADITWDKKIRPSDQPNFVSLDKVNEFEVRSNFSVISLIFLRRLEIYSYLGVSKEKMDWENKPQYQDKSELKARNHFSYSVGAKAILLYFWGMALGIDGQYFALPSSNKLAQRIINLRLPLELSSQYLKLEEWHIALGLGTKLGPFAPYVGINYMKMRLDVQTKDKSDLPTLQFCNRNNWGGYAGCSLNFSHSFYVNFEGRFIDETAISVAAITSF